MDQVLAERKMMKEKIVMNIYQSEAKVWEHILAKSEMLYQVESLLSAGMVGTLCTLGVNMLLPSWKNLATTAVGALAWRWITSPQREKDYNMDFFDQEVDQLVEKVTDVLSK
jgi:hypothetical protein